MGIFLDHERCERLLKDDTSTDFRITCNGICFKVHKFMVRVRCDFFECMLRNQCFETESDTLDLPEDDPLVIACMLNDIYFGSLSVKDLRIPYSPDHSVGTHENLMSAPSTPDAKFAFLINLYFAADKFGVDDLKSKARHLALICLRHCHGDFKAGEPDEMILDNIFLHTDHDRRDLLRMDVVREYLQNKSLREGKHHGVIERHEPLAWCLGKEYLKLN